MLFLAFADSRIERVEPKLAKIEENEITKNQILKNIDILKQTYNARLREIADQKNGVEKVSFICIFQN